MPKKKARAKPKAKAKAKPQAESQEKPPRMTAAEQVDRELAAEALRKRQAGQKPSARETAAGDAVLLELGVIRVEHDGNHRPGGDRPT